jgi:hypothetical protein
LLLTERKIAKGKIVMSLIKNWKTGLSGAALILTALADLATQAASGAWDGNRLIADLTALGSGLGLIFAKDGNVTGGTVKQ